MPTVRIDADRRTTRAYGGRALHEALEAEHEGTSRKIGEVIVNTLGGDHTLRHAYLRMRWQGLGSDLDNRGEGSGRSGRADGRWTDAGQGRDP
jgi:hypothetical protein